MSVTQGPGVYLANQICDLLRGTAIVPPASLTLRLCSTATTATALGTAQTGTDYADKSITLNTTNFTTPTVGTLTIHTDQNFTNSANGWSTPIASAALIDGSANIWWFWNFAPTQPVSNGDIVDFPVDDLSLSFQASTSPVTGAGQYLANQILKLFQGVTLTPPASLNARLFTTAISWTALGTEMTGTGYAAVAYSLNTTNFSAAAAGGAISNSVAITWSSGTSGWATPITGIAFTDGSSNIWWFMNLASSKPVADGNVVSAAIAALTFEVTDLTA